MHSPVKWAAMVACVLLSIATAGAVPVTYDFVAGSSITWQHCSAGMCGGAGPTDAVSGSFSYDATTTDMSAVNVVLSGAGVGGAVGGLTGALIGMGIPEYEAKRYEGRLQKGGILLSLHCDTSEEIKRAKEVLKRTGAEDVSSTGEASVDSKAARANQ